MSTLLSLPMVSPNWPAGSFLTDEQKARRGKIAAGRRARKLERDSAFEHFGKLLVFRRAVIRARLQAHELGVVSWLGLTMLSLTPMERWLGQPCERRVLTFFAHEYHQRFVAAAMANASLAMTPADVLLNPPVRVRFEQASAYGTVGECLEATKNKTWGKLVSVDPVEPDFPFDAHGGRHILYLFHETSRYNQRFEQRAWLKRRLGRGHRSLVGAAMRTLKEFLPEVTEADRAALAARLGVTPEHFWRAVKGHVRLPRPAEPVQGELFDE